MVFPVIKSRSSGGTPFGVASLGTGSPTDSLALHRGLGRFGPLGHNPSYATNLRTGLLRVARFFGGVDARLRNAKLQP
jgi:hypothetical protein